MHRTTCLPRSLAWSLALGFLINALAQAVTAQGVDRQLPGFAQQPNLVDGKGTPNDGPEPGVIVLPKDSTRQIEMSTKELISVFRSENPNVVRVQALLENPRAVLVTGVGPGSARIFITDVKKNMESLEVRVLRGDEEEAAAREARERQEGAVKKAKLLELIHKTVPTAIVDVQATKNIFQSGSTYTAPIGSSVTYVGKKWTVILSGTVPLAESVQVITNLANGVFEDANVVNYMIIPGVQQVQLEVTVALVNRTRERQIGFSFINAGQHHFLASTVGGSGSLAGVGSGTGLPSVLTPLATLTATPNAVFGIFNDKQSFLGFLTALTNEGVAKFIAEPRLITLSGRPAYFISGGDQAVPQVSGLGGIAGVDFKPFGTEVSFLPIVLGNGKIHMDVEPTITRLDDASGTSINGTRVPGRTKQNVKTSVEMEDGQTLAIGGLIQNSIDASNSKVPILGDIPFLAFAFSSKTYREAEQELVILVTPHLVHPMACNQLQKYLPGRETRSPDDFELFLEGILEAPRGPRTLGHPYTPAYMNGPSAGLYPCGGGAGGSRGCGIACGCGNTGTGAGNAVDSAYPTAGASGTPLAALPQTAQPAALDNNNVRPLANTPPVPASPVVAPSAPPQTLPPATSPGAASAAPTAGATFGPAVMVDPR